MIEDQNTKDSIFRIGCVFSVAGRTIQVRVDKVKNSTHLVYNGALIKNVSVGSYVKIVKGFTRIIGKVEGEFIVENKEIFNKKYTSNSERIVRNLQVSLLGFF